MRALLLLLLTSCATAPPPPTPEARVAALWACYGQKDAPPEVVYVNPDPVRCPDGGYAAISGCLAGEMAHALRVYILRGPAERNALAHELLHVADLRARRSRSCPCTRGHADSFYADNARCLAATARRTD